MKITILVEGRTEQAFKPHLTRFLRERLAGRMPRIDMFPYHGPIAKGEALRRKVATLLTAGKDTSDAVIALTDVYTGRREFADAEDAIRRVSQWVGPEPRFFVHVAQYDFEAWLLPYWDEIRKLAGHNRASPAPAPETVNHHRPPSMLLKEIFRAGTCGRDYSKPRDGNRILRGKDLTVAARQCPQLRAFLNRILELCGAPQLD